MSKHGGGCRYNAILKFQGEQIKKEERKRKISIKREKYMYEKKRKI
jgi:hypothetical protein